MKEQLRDAFVRTTRSRLYGASVRICIGSTVVSIRQHGFSMLPCLSADSGIKRRENKVVKKTLLHVSLLIYCTASLSSQLLYIIDFISIAFSKNKVEELYSRIYFCYFSDEILFLYYNM